MKKVKMKNKQKEIYRSIVIVLIVLVFLFFVFSNYRFFADYQEMSKISSNDYIDLRMRSLSSDLNIFPRNSVNDISYLAKIDCTKNIFIKDSKNKTS